MERPSSTPGRRPASDGLTRRALLGAAAGSLVGATAVRAAPALLRRRSPNEALQVGMIGLGERGGLGHLEALGFKAIAARERPEGSNGQPVREPHAKIPGVEVVAVCDTFDEHRDAARASIAKGGVEPRAYVDYRAMLAAEDLDAVIVATPDFTHGPIAMAAARAGCDVYVEKCMTNRIEEAVELGCVLAETGRLVQVGYQLRQDNTHALAREFVQRGYIGEVHHVQSVLRRNGSTASFRRAIAEGGGPPRESIDWEAFLAGAAPAREYDPQRYFEWRRYWDYSTGVCGDLLSHMIDEAALVLDLGAPRAAVASGGIYYWKDGRETPDTLSSVLEYPERDLSISFTVTTSNSYPEQATLFLGTEGTLKLSWKLEIFPDTFGKYADMIRSGKLGPGRPFVDVEDKAAARALVAAPSQLWLAGRGATLTTRGDVELDTTRLHHENFFECVRSRAQPAASFERALGSTVAAHLCTIAYREGRRAGWDAQAQRVV